MLNQFKDYFYFNRTERKGVLSLLFLLAIVIIFNQSMIYFNPDPLNSQEKYNSLMAKIDSVAKLDSLKAVEYEVKYKVERVKTILDFNPNELTSQGWQNLGLSEKQAQVILNYKAKAGEFKSKASVKKMFVISDSLYAKIEPHILLPENDPPKEYKDNFNKEKWKEKPRKKKAYPKVLFNTADTAELKKISGIGSFLSKNIVKYRESLGGFHNKKQLKEVYGLKEELLIRIDTQLVFSTIELRKLNINTATAEELKSHPYIRWKVANSIVKYREQHGSYEELTELKKLILVSDELYEKLLPYLEI